LDQEGFIERRQRRHGSWWKTCNEESNEETSDEDTDILDIEATDDFDVVRNTVFERYLEPESLKEVTNYKFSCCSDELESLKCWECSDCII
jgi:hypothetical protein